MLEHDKRRPLRRSAGLVRGHWWRAASLTAVVTGTGLLVGPFVGVLMLFVTGASFNVVNLVAGLVYVFTLPFAAIVSTYLYFDLLVAERRGRGGRRLGRGSPGRGVSPAGASPAPWPSACRTRPA